MSNVCRLQFVDYKGEDVEIVYDDILGWVFDGRSNTIRKLYEQLGNKFNPCYEPDFFNDIKGDVVVYGANPNKGTVGTVKVTFNDGKTETSNCYEPDEFDPEYGVALCILKHAMGGTARFYRTLRHGLKKYRRQVANEEAEKKAKEEKEKQEKRRYEKRMKEKERRNARREEEERKKKEEERKEWINELAEAIAKSKTIAKFQRKVRRHQDKEGK